MTRLELLTIVVGRARSNGFEFRRWYITRLGLPWISAEAALTLLDQQRRYYALLFAHEFACAFWKAGEEISFRVPAQTFERPMPDGSLKTIHRKPYTRRSGRRDAWLYHLREMALAEEPLRYLRKYLNVADDFTDDIAAAVAEQTPLPIPKLAAPVPPPSLARRSREKPIARPIPTETPAFLRRPFH
jgi:hypothetical protein